MGQENGISVVARAIDVRGPSAVLANVAEQQKDSIVWLCNAAHSAGEAVLVSIGEVVGRHYLVILRVAKNVERRICEDERRGFVLHLLLNLGVGEPLDAVLVVNKDRSLFIAGTLAGLRGLLVLSTSHRRRCIVLGEAIDGIEPLLALLHRHTLTEPDIVHLFFIAVADDFVNLAPHAPDRLARHGFKPLFEVRVLPQSSVKRAHI